MAKNKITHDWNEDGTAIIFTGSQRQPTLTEIHICGKPFVLDADFCPICHKKWYED